MATLKRYVEYQEFPRFDGKVNVLIRGSQLFLCKEGTNDIWLELEVSPAEKRDLLKILLREFLGLE